MRCVFLFFSLFFRLVSCVFNSSQTTIVVLVLVLVFVVVLVLVGVVFRLPNRNKPKSRWYRWW